MLYRPSIVRTLAAGSAVVALHAVLTVTAAQAFNTREQLAFTSTGAITIDGNGSDAQWANAFTFRMEDGAPLAAATMKGGFDGTNLYLHFTVEDRTCDQDTDAGCILSDTPIFNGDDTVVIAYTVDGSASGYRRYHIQPCLAPAGTLCPSSGSPNPASNQEAQIQHWTGTLSGSTITWTAAAVPAGVMARTNSAYGPAGAGGMFASTGTWSLEVRLPKPSTSTFGLFISAISVDSSQDAATQYTWPPFQQIGDADGNSVAASIENTPPPSQWGVATLGTAGFSDVQLVGFGSNHPDSSQIALNRPNNFHAVIRNGTAVAANNVRVRMKIANWGLPSLPSWGDVPPSNTTAIPDQNIQPNAYTTFQSGNWTLSAAEQEQYSPPNHHQCIRVELSDGANPGGPSSFPINQPVRQFNMDFVDITSPFESKPRIGTKGLEKLVNDGPAFVLRERFYNMAPQLRFDSKFGGAEQVAAGVWHVKGAFGEDIRLESTVLADEKLRLQSQTYKLPPGTGAPRTRFLNVRVRANQLVTLIPEGTITIGEIPVAPDGTLLKGDQPGGEPPRGLRGGPGTRVGAVIGSFDNFQKSGFVIGSGISVKVPRGARTLSIIIDDTREGYRRHRGEGFAIQVVATPIERYMLAMNPDLARPAVGDRMFFPVGINLPTYMIRGELETGKFIRIGRKIFRMRMPYGSFGNIVRSVRSAQ